MVDLKKPVDSFKDEWNFLKGNFKNFFINSMKIQALAVLPIIIIVILGAFLFLSMDVLPAVVLAIILLAIGMFVSVSMDSVIYNLTDNSFKKKKTGIIKNFKRNFLPVSGYIIFMSIVVGLIIAVPLILLLPEGFVEGTDSTLEKIIYPRLVSALISVVAMLFAFFLQFSMLELVISRRGIIGSIKRSISLVKNNFWETIAFSILMTIVVWIISIPAILIIFMLIMPMAFGFMIAPLAGGWIILVAYILFWIIMILILSIVLQAFEYTVTMPARYSFWKKISKK